VFFDSASSVSNENVIAPDAVILMMLRSLICCRLCGENRIVAFTFAQFVQLNGDKCTICAPHRLFAAPQCVAPLSWAYHSMFRTYTWPVRTALFRRKSISPRVVFVVWFRREYGALGTCVPQDTTLLRGRVPPREFDLSSSSRAVMPLTPREPVRPMQAALGLGIAERSVSGSLADC